MSAVIEICLIADLSVPRVLMNTEDVSGWSGSAFSRVVSRETADWATRL